MLVVYSVVSYYRCITPDQWENFSNQNILKAEKERNASSMLRGVICGVLDQTKQDMLRQRAVVDQSFEQRIAETQEAKDSLEDHLTKVYFNIRTYEYVCVVHNSFLEGEETTFGYVYRRSFKVTKISTSNCIKSNNIAHVQVILVN